MQEINIFRVRISCKHSYRKCCIQGKVSVNESDKYPKSCWKPFFTFLHCGDLIIWRL